MVFDSLVFVLFALLVGALYLGGGFSWRVRKLILLVASYVFYAAWNPLFVGLLWFSTIVDWFTARGIAASESPRRRKLLLWVSLCSNLGLLAFFKYSLFLARNAVAGANALGMGWAEPAFSIVLPVGISFYTFQTLSYTIDIYRGTLQPAKRFEDFALFVTFFPQLVAGPIVRAADFMPQLEAEQRPGRDALGWGVALMILGLFEKVVLADAFLAPVVDNVYNAAGALHWRDAWLGTLAFAGQIFFDFAGYSTCAIGAALCLGFELPDNFKFPYAARGFSDFWRRWHISLSTWLRDYLYISLGGNRHGPARTYFALSMTMLLGGLWHGASWAFIVWGALHGAYLVVERLLREQLKAATWAHNLAGRALGWAVTFAAVCYAWVFFRATTFARAWEVVLAMTGMGASRPSGLTTTGNAAVVLGVVGGLLASHLYMRDRTLRDVAERAPAWVIGLVIWLMCVAMAMSTGGDRAFIYFQF